MQLHHAKMRLAAQRQRALVLQPNRRIETFKQRLQTLSISLNRSWAVRQAHRHQLFNTNALHQQLESLWQRQIGLYHERLQNLASAIQAIDPSHLLARGYSILFSEKEGSVISSVRTLQQGQAVHIRLSDGQALATINQVIPK